MNLNQSLVNRKMIRNNRNGGGIAGFRVGPIRPVMGPPIRPAPKRRSNSTPSSATNWGRSHHSPLNNSTVRSGNTTFSTETDSRVIIALTEGRGDARCEVGMASIDISLPTLILCQISDAQSYINTLTKINILNPTDIIVPSTFLDSYNNRLVDKIKKQFPKIKIMSTPRKTFNKSNGMDRILQLCLPSINTICVGLQHKYYALAAASALITYLQNNLNIYYANESLMVTYQESEGYAIIDVSTADRLELVSSTKPIQATRHSSLFGVLNYCFTKIGARCLRSTILQPPCLPQIIEQTSQCVTELMKHPQMLLQVQTILQKVTTIDQLLTITTMTFGSSDNCSVRHLNYILLLNSLIDLIEPLKGMIENCQQPFFRELKQTLESDKFDVIKKQIRDAIHPSAQFARSEAGITQRCFAIKSGVNGLLDLVRKTYSERLNDMTDYVKYLGNKYNLPLTLANNNAKGYHIVLKLNYQQKRLFKKSDLPSEFIQVYRLAGSCTMKTAELINYSTRLEDIMMEILKISNVMIQKTLIDLKQHIGFFYKLCEDVARLDMLQSLAEASRRGKYVRPKFGDFTELTRARHPMLELLIDEPVPNPISICGDFNVQIITGPNGSGKSVYIRQVMLLQVMAQVGCYVPADCAIFRPINRMFARIYLEDNMEHGASAFILEMKEVKYMLTLLSENSLFILDEPCRSTSADEGAALAMAICEKFCSTSVFLYVTTHYTSLADLSDMYLNVKTWQMETVSSGDKPEDLNLNFKFRIIPGVTNLKHYGVYVVKNIWPDSVLEDVYKILNSLKSISKRRKFVGVNQATKLKYKLESHLRKLKSSKILTGAEINNLLSNYMDELQKLEIFVNMPLEHQVIPETRDDDQFLIIGDAEEDIVTPEFSQNDFSEFETSSYRNILNFLREDSDNINKLIPEVAVTLSEREFNIRSETLEESNKRDDGEIENHLTNLYFDITNQKAVTHKSVSKTQSVSTPTPWGVGAYNNLDKDDDIASLLDDLSCSESFFDDENFGSQASSYKTAVTTSSPEKRHIVPIVTIIEGPNWSSDSSPSRDTPKEDNIQDGEVELSISYSPLCSPSSNSKISGGHSKNSDPTFANESNAVTTSTSSLHFLAKKDELDGSSQTNLENISINRAIDTITPENLKSETTGKTPSKSSSSKTTPTSSSLKESDKSNDCDPKKKRKSKKKAPAKASSSDESKPKPPRKFVPPKKLTKKEIQDEFNEQDRKLYETDISNPEFSKYLSQMLKRPSVRQVQNSTYLAFGRRTEEGVEVIPATPEPKKRKFPFKRNLSSSSNVDMTIFSDKNAKCFDEFLNSSERDVKRFKFNFNSEPERQFSFNPASISDYAIGGNGQFSLRNDHPNVFGSQHFQSLTPDGYYKQNKDGINDVVDKYLREGDEARTGISESFDRKSTQESIFESCSFNPDCLEL